MKKILKSLMFGFLLLPWTAMGQDVVSSSALADGDDIVGKVKEAPPPALKDGEITIQTKEGTSSKYNSNDWKVVPRYKYLRRKPVPKKEVQTETVIVEKLVQKKNQIAVHAGIGFDGLTSKVKGDPDDNNVDVAKKQVAIFGLSYTRYFDESWSAIGTALSNQSFLIGGGYSW
jgi:hypothetical protein